MREDARLEPRISAGDVVLPGVDVVDAQGMSWRRDPFKEKLIEGACSAEDFRRMRTMLDAALRYLAGCQQKDGGWDVVAHGGSKTNEWGRVGVTGLACLALMGDGHVWLPVGSADGKPVVPLYGNKLRDGINFLTCQQRMDGADAGLIGEKMGHFMYNQGFATAALCEAYAMSGDPYLGRAATAAVNYIVSAQQTSGGWDYFEKPGTRADTSVTVCQLMALFSARMSGITVPDAVFLSGLKWIDSVTDPKTFNVGYDAQWKESDRHVGYGSTAMALAAQMYLGRSPSAESIRRQARTLLSLKPPPEYNAKWTVQQQAEQVDYYYLHHGTMAFHRLGGDAWKTWSAALLSLLEATQTKGGTALAGSWTGHDVHGKAGGRIFVTAVCALTLEAAFRYP
jgi:prenyltransferase beta subunit